MEQHIDVNASQFDIRYMEPSDSAILKEWLKLPEVLEWLPISDEKEAEIFLNIWNGYSKYHCCLTATWKHVPCGMGIIYLMPYRKVAHRCLSQVVVPPPFQGQGIEGAVLKNLAHLAKAYFRLESIQMEVIEGAPVIASLEEQGFAPFVQQEKFFKREGEYAARIMYERDLKDESK